MRIVKPGKRSRTVAVEAIPRVFYRFNANSKRPEVVVELVGVDGNKYQVCATFPEWTGTMALILMSMQENTP